MMRRLPPALVLMFATISVALAQTPDAPPGASSCSGCHAVARGVETPAPRLVGRTASDISAAMTAFKSGARHATVMDRIAKGFTEPEIAAIAAWYGAQKD